MLKAFTRLSNCCLVTVIEQSALDGTLLLTAALFSAGQRPLMLITGVSGGSSAGCSSRFNNEGGVACGVGVGLAEGAFVVAPCFLVAPGVCASAVDAIKTQIMSLRIIVGFLSSIREVRRQYPSIMVFWQMQPATMVVVLGTKNLRQWLCVLG